MSEVTTLNIPFDVVTQIVKWVSSWNGSDGERLQTLVSLTLVNKFFHVEATNHMYASPPAIGCDCSRGSRWTGSASLAVISTVNAQIKLLSLIRTSARHSYMVQHLALSICEQFDYEALGELIPSSIESSGDEEVSNLLQVISIHRNTLEFLSIDYNKRRSTAIYETRHERRRELVKGFLPEGFCVSEDDTQLSKAMWPLPNIKALRFSHWEAVDLFFPVTAQPGQIVHFEINEPLRSSRCAAFQGLTFAYVPFEYDGKPGRRRRFMDTLHEETLLTMEDITTSLLHLEVLRVTNPPTKNLMVDISRLRRLRFLFVYTKFLGAHFTTPVNYDSLNNYVLGLFQSLEHLVEVHIETDLVRRTWTKPISTLKASSAHTMGVREIRNPESDNLLFDWESFGYSQADYCR
ncbi:hypothetical protein CVT24_002370 [Panaeolus cyanescens]|uniref:Uncharacterized protein n=1 Tax=Panaeolus cyanescens TaxID=181874 RepID=A0A409W181_9AGAR|nr:hypothetical protein CVT24_002370 [Panaeolus cyanescens]